MPLFETLVRFTFPATNYRGSPTKVLVEAADEDAVPSALDEQLKHRDGLDMEILDMLLAPMQRPE